MRCFCKSGKNVDQKLTMPQNLRQSRTFFVVSKALIASHLSFIAVNDGLPSSIRNLYPM